jgi:formylglycine-generating enzyme required for sulfatase activity
LGRLPSAQEWDRAGGKGWVPAGGRFDPAGPFLKGWKEGEIAIGLDGPRPVGASPADQSIAGCRDMAGNGYELTRTLNDGGRSGEDVPLAKPRPEDFVVLRGQRWGKKEPFKFQETRSGLLPYGESRSYVGFRVVILVPAAGP